MVFVAVAMDGDGMPGFQAKLCSLYLAGKKRGVSSSVRALMPAGEGVPGRWAGCRAGWPTGSERTQAHCCTGRSPPRAHPPLLPASCDLLSCLPPQTPTSLQWFLEVYPRLPPEQRPLEVLQRAGDTLFVPAGGCLGPDGAGGRALRQRPLTCCMHLGASSS